MRVMTTFRSAAAAALLAIALAACSQPEAVEGFHELPAAEAAQYRTAYIAAVQVPAGEVEGYILLRNNWDGPADLGGWAILGRNNRRIPIPPSTILEPEGALRVILDDREAQDGELVLDVDEEILEWDRLRLVDAAGETVSRFVYGR